MTGLSNRLESVRSRLRRAVDNSLLVEATRRVERNLTRWFHGSRIVQWFLAEPDPDVIVVDLRETYTVGPLLGVIEWVAGAGRRLGERTGVTDAVDRSTDRVASEPLRISGIVLLAAAIGGLVVALSTAGSTGGWLMLLGVGLLATREHRSMSELAATPIGRALKAAFEPPEPPDGDA